MRRRAFLAAILPGPGALRRGADFLWRAQSPDGGWHSRTYGLLRSGQSLTGLIVNALLDAGVHPSDTRLVRATSFLTRNIHASGALGLTGDDYPCYATALALRAFVRTRRGPAPRLAAWLRTQQMSPENGWNSSHAAFGAWGIGGAPRQAPDPGHIDISMTRYVMEALATFGAGEDGPALQNALVFLRRCQNPDGGFFFSTVETGANKAGETESSYASYATTTADGAIALNAAGQPCDKAIAWLEANDSAILPAGFPPARQRYADGLRFYHAAASAAAFRAAGRTRPPRVARALARDQHADGGWRNPQSLVKEDDPLIATALAVTALALG